jgi:DNA-binding LacI/PurR family transcriptional regulator
MPTWAHQPMSDSMKSRYQEVARIAGVSLATVYRVLNRRGHGIVRAATQERVSAAAGKLGLNSHANAKTKLLAFLLGNRTVSHPFHSRILAGAEAQCIQRDYNLVILSLRYPSSVDWKKMHLPRVLRLHDVVDGFIVVGDNSQNLLDLLAHKGLPFVVQGNSVRDPWRSSEYDAVYFDDIKGARQMTRYLQSLGHRDIWFVGNRKSPSFERTYQGYEQGMIELGLTPRSEGFDSDQHREAGYLATLSLLGRGERVSAIFAGSDPTAVGVYEALRESDKRVPDDISVAGFDDIEARVLQPTLTTAHIFLQEIGKKLADLVLNRIENPHLPPQQVAIPTQVVRRESCRRLFPQAEARPEVSAASLAAGVLDSYRSQE